MKRALKGALVLVWVAALGTLIYQGLRRAQQWDSANSFSALGGDVSEEANPLVPESVRDLWFGTYLKDTKVGFSHSRMRPVPGGIAFEDESRMDLKLLGEPRTIEMHQHGRLGEDFSLERMVFALRSEGSHFEAEIWREGEVLRAILRTGGGEQPIEFPVQGSLYSPAAIYPFLRAKGLRVGEEHSLMVFDPAAQQKTLLEAKVAAKEMVDVAGVQRELYRIEQRMLEVSTVAWVDEDAGLWMERSPEGFTLMRESEKAAQEGITGGDLDMALLFRVPLAGPIARPERLLSVTYRVEGLPETFGDLDDFRQQRAGKALAVRREVIPRRGAYTLPLTGGEEAEFLASEPLIPVEDKRLGRKAREILAGERDPVQAARLLAGWVYTELDKTPVVGIPNALEALSTRQGDCNEHATLLVALARAAGLPARVAVGLVHQAGSFYYHAWTELFVGEWITADAALGQLPADATHIRLARGSLGSQAKIANLLGRLRMEVEQSEAGAPVDSLAFEKGDAR